MERDADRIWELWNIRAFWPNAGPEDLERIRQDKIKVLAKEREAFAGLWTGDRELLAPGHRFFADHPELRTGVTISLHQGPYKLVPELFLDQGISPVVLVNEAALEKMRPDIEKTAERLGLKAPISWIAVGAPRFAMELIRVAREGRPIVVYFDGNSGGDGYVGTRDQGLPYRLPGREIRIRTGLARLVCRLGLPVHLVSVSWDKKYRPIWRKEPSQSWDRTADPDQVTRLMADWVFSEVRAHPEQWHFWTMIKESCACFSTSGLTGFQVPEGLHRDYQDAFLTCCHRSPETVRLILQSQAEVWPGGVLADLTDDRFFDSAGMRDEDLDTLRLGEPTLAELESIHGQAWVRFHGLRLCLLGMARLGG
ncbi:MAG: hypothetical protein KOO60_05030 [Gemmatimonadales bacterium]|nr:hypothetical protein [Gemmatimonadales bacterium]